jgi:hypothetical protein
MSLKNNNLKRGIKINLIERKLSFFYALILEQEYARMLNDVNYKNILILDKQSGVLTTREDSFVFSDSKKIFINHAESGLENLLFNFDSPEIIRNSGVLGMFIRFEDSIITLRLFGANPSVVREAQEKPIGIDFLYIVEEGLDLLFSKFTDPVDVIRRYSLFKLDNASIEVLNCCINEKNTIIDISFRKNPTFLIS